MQWKIQNATGALASAAAEVKPTKSDRPSPHRKSTVENCDAIQVSQILTSESPQKTAGVVQKQVTVIQNDGEAMSDDAPCNAEIWVKMGCVRADAVSGVTVQLICAPNWLDDVKEQVQKVQEDLKKGTVGFCSDDGTVQYPDNSTSVDALAEAVCKTLTARLGRKLLTLPVPKAKRRLHLQR